MSVESIFRKINACPTVEDTFNCLCRFFEGQGFRGFCYMAPEGVVGRYLLLQRGMPDDWVSRYQKRDYRQRDPIPAAAFRLGTPERLSHLIAGLTGLSTGEKAYLEDLVNSGLTDGLVIPAYGPLGRPGLIGLTQIVHPDLLDNIDIYLVAAVAQQAHIRMEILQSTGPGPLLSPCEREVLYWLAKGKSNGDIAEITGRAASTIATHVRRIYAKLGVNDRVSCIARAIAGHHV